MRHFAQTLAPAWLKTEVKLRTKYRRMRHGEVRGYSFVQYDEHQCVFVHIPKTAGVSVTRTLFGNMGGGHVSMSTMRRVFGEETLAKYYKFTFVRNPYDRLVSAYRFLRKGGMDADDRRFADNELRSLDSFTDFVQQWVTPRNVERHLHFIPQIEWLRLGDRPLAVDFLGRYEHLADDFSSVCRHLGIRAQLEHHNATKKQGDYRSYYNDESIRIVGDVYGADIKLLGYDFDGLLDDADNSEG